MGAPAVVAPLAEIHSCSPRYIMMITQLPTLNQHNSMTPLGSYILDMPCNVNAHLK